MGGEIFTASGLVVEQKNYLEIFTFDKWAEKEMPTFEQDEKFCPNKIEICKSKSQPP